MPSGLKYFGFLMLLTIFISCDENGIEEGTFYERLLPFTTLELNSVFDVYLIQDTIYAVKIVGNPQVIKNIRFKVENGILRISNDSRGKWLQPEENKVKLFISSNRLSQIFPKETCYIETVNPIITDDFSIIQGNKPKLSQINLTLDCGTFFYWNNYQCGGKLTLSGKTKNLIVYSFALMSVNARELRTDYALIENNSKGDCEVFVTNMLEYSIRGVGDIYLHGNPNEIIANEQTSTGQLIQLD